MATSSTHSPSYTPTPKSHILSPLNAQFPITTTTIATQSLLHNTPTMFSALNSAVSHVLLCLRTSYLLPAILLNPAFLVHCLNTYVSHILYNTTAFSPSISPYPTFENLGPIPNAPVLFDVHEQDGLLWVYTVFSVVMQIWVFGKVTRSREIAKSEGNLGGASLLGLHWESKTVRDNAKAV